MRYAGITRQLDKLGRIVIPKEFRKLLGIEVLETLEIFLIAETIVIKKRFRPCCALCCEETNLVEFNEKHICAECIKRLKNLF